MCVFVSFHCSLDLLRMHAGNSCFLCLVVYWEASPSQAIIEVKTSEADAKKATTEAAKKIAYEIVLKICNDLYDEVMPGQ